MHGDDVTFPETWAYQLSETLAAKGLNSEVMNFGVGAYGIDQAYLRWKVPKGGRYMPDVVLIGFQPDNCLRNLNVIRKIRFPGTGVPFSKPRFVIDGDDLTLVNFPTIPYRDVANEVEHFGASPLRKFEHFYDESNYAHRAIFASRLVGVVDALLDRPKPFNGIFVQDGEESELCFRVIQRFFAEAANYSTPFVVHLPTHGEIVSLSRGNELPYARLLARLKDHMRVIDPSSTILSESKGDIEAMFQGHYSGLGNKAIATAVALSLSSFLEHNERPQ